ncbi:MAG: sugar phosphate nucleotidyltransferase [Sphaerochaeta sp.]|nr:sugar phosphate nucleotidyltransferase [Sphaerochaeta sp.]
MLHQDGVVANSVDFGLYSPVFKVIIHHMNIHMILLSGGSGKRLWPLSNEVRSKQFLRVLENGSGDHESMLQRVFRQLRAEFSDAHVVVATGAAQREQILSQLGDAVDIVSEPQRRDTFPAIALATTFLHDSCGSPDNDVVVVLPVDVFAEQHYFSTLGRMCEVVEAGGAELVLMGIAPTFTSSRFGYMVPGKPAEGYALIERFVEKPPLKLATDLIAGGALWNGGVFAFRLGYLMDIVRSHVGKLSFSKLHETYETLEKTSFDYAVVEKASSVAMVPYDGMWKDLGTWDALAQEIGPQGIGEQLLSTTTEGTVVVNELEIPVVVVGTRNLIVAASPDGILVSDTQPGTELKPLVDTLGHPPRFEQLRWGTRTVLDRRHYGRDGAGETREVELDALQEASITCAVGTILVMVCTTGRGSWTIGRDTIQVEAGTTIPVASGASGILYSENGLRLVEIVVPNVENV